MVPLGCASKAGILKWWHTTFAHTFVCTQPQNAKILLENIYADENVFFRIPSNLLLFNKNFVKLNSGESNLLYGHLFKRIIIFSLNVNCSKPEVSNSGGLLKAQMKTWDLMVGFIYTFSYSLLSTSSILE